MIKPRFSKKELLVVLVALSIMVGFMNCRPQDQSEIVMACEWVLFELQKESFVFNLEKREVYWVNENKRYPLEEINEGRIVFQGIRSSLLVDRNVLPGIPPTYQKNVAIKFTINRVTGELDLQGVKVPAGYRNRCRTIDKAI